MSDLIYVLLVAHFIGDFLCQSDWMALNKSKRWDALAIHVGIYALVLYACVPLVAIALGVPPPHGSATLMMPLFALVNFNLHFWQDAITSRINAKLWQANQRHWFFVGIGADQLLHYITLFVTADLWLRP